MKKTKITIDLQVAMETCRPTISILSIWDKQTIPKTKTSVMISHDMIVYVEEAV